MRKLWTAALFLGLLAGVVYVLWQLKGGEQAEVEPATEAAPVTARLKGGASSAVSKPMSMPGAPAFTEDEDPAGTLQLEGQVLGSGDLPVGGAVVTINSRPKRTVRTEEDGSFSFDKLVGRAYVIVARAGDLAGGPVMHELTGSSEPAVIRLRAGATLTVTVVTASKGAPVAGATVKLRTRENRQVTTDDKGMATFRGVREGGKLVIAWADGHAPGRKLLSVPRDASAPVKVKISLTQGVPVSGIVVDEAGAPIEGAKVGARQMADLHGGLGRTALDPVKTDAGGAFTIPALSAGTYRVTARHKQHAPGTSKPVVVGTAPVKGARITLKAGAVLAGKVLDASGQPAAWATVRVGPDEPGRARGGRARFRKATADKDGAFRLEGLARAKLAVAASAEGGSSKIATADLAARRKVEDLVLKLELQGVIAGTVVDSAGEPLPEVQVSAMPDIFARGAMKQLYMRGLGGQLTDGGGKFKFSGLPDGKFRLRASRSGLSRRMYRLRKGVEASTGDMNVRLVLETPGRIKGQVQDQHGDAVKSFSVTVGEPPSSPVANDEGRFERGAIPPGKYDITIRASGYAPAVSTGVQVKAGEVSDLGTLKMERGRSVNGQVLNASGAPVAGAKVVVGKKLVGDGKSMLADLGQAFEEGAAIRRGESDAEGNYTVSGIGQGKQLIAAEHTTGGRSSAAPVPEGKEDARIDLKLRPLGALTGKVTYGDKAAGGVMVVATQKGSRNQSLLVTTDAEGLYLFEKLAAGEYDLMAMSKTGLGGKSGGAVTVIKAGERATADIHVEAGEIDLQVTVAGVGGAKIDLAQVFLFKGGLSPKNGKQVQEAFLGKAKGGGAMMGFAKPPAAAQFKKMVPAAYSVCVLPINGDIQDASFRAALQKHADKLAVHCKPYTVAASPAKQAFTATVPPMTPLPKDEAEKK